MFNDYFELKYIVFITKYKLPIQRIINFRLEID